MRNSVHFTAALAICAATMALVQSISAGIDVTVQGSDNYQSEKCVNLPPVAIIDSWGWAMYAIPLPASGGELESLTVSGAGLFYVATADLDELKWVWTGPFTDYCELRPLSNFVTIHTTSSPTEIDTLTLSLE